VFQNIDLEKKVAATTRQDSEGARREVSFWQTFCAYLFTSSPETCASPLAFLDSLPSVEEIIRPLLSCHISYNLWIFLSIDVSLFPSKNILSGTTLPTFTLRVSEPATTKLQVMTANIKTWRFFWVPPTWTCIQIWSSTNMKWANCTFHLSIHRQNHVPLVVSKLYFLPLYERPQIPSASSKNISCTQHPLQDCKTTYIKQDTYSTVT
jgi:hypothetical protein